MVACCGLQDGSGQWLSMDSEIIMKNGEPIGTQGPTGHYVLLDAHFELPSGLSLNIHDRGVSSCSSLGWPVGWPHLYSRGGQEFRKS